MNLLRHIPEKQHFYFNINVQNKIDNLRNEEKKLIEDVKNYIEKYSWKWKIDKNFVFNIPPTVFEFERIIDIPDSLKYKSQQTEYSSNELIGAKFSSKILEQIWENGKFEVESKRDELPYTWKLTKLIIKGNKNVTLTYLKEMSKSFYFIYTLKNRFETKNYDNIFPITYLSSFYYIYKTGYDLLNLLVGMPMYRNNDFILIEKIKHDDLLKFISLNPNFNYNLYDKKEIKENILKIDNEFLHDWKLNILPQKLKIYKQQKLDKQTISVNTNNDEKKELKKFLNEKNICKNLKKKFPNIEQFLDAQQIIINEKFKIDEEYEQKIKEYEKELEKHTIKILCDIWLKEKKEKFSTILKKEKNQKLTRIIKEKIQNMRDPYTVYTFNIESKEQLPEKLKEEKKKNKEPLFQFCVTRLRIKPYEVKRKIIDQTVYYSLDDKSCYYIKTNFFCWRIWLFLVKLFCTFWNLNVRSFRIMISSPLGIKALFLKEFYSDININITTGAIYECNRVFTFPMSVCNLMKWIYYSRRDFENSPDTGILGKGFSRIFNLIINYVFKFLILGSLFVCIYPSLIVANVIICSWLMLLSPIIAPLWNLLDYLFSMLIFNRYDILNFFHLFTIIFVDLIINSVFQFIFCTISIIIQPIISLFILIFAHIHYILRYTYDLFFYYILKLFGKIPLTDSFIAWRISGPHLFRERYYDISNRDLMSLVIAEIEKMVMKNYSEEMNEILDGPYTCFYKIEELFSIINVRVQMNREINESISFYKNLLNEQIRSAQKYPILGHSMNVKFTEERLNEVKDLIQTYLINYTMGNDLSFVLDNYEDRKIEQLTEKILKNIFSSRIFETLDEADKIVHLESVFTNGLDEISQRIFEDPRFDDRLIVEERKVVKEEKIIKLPITAYFADVFRYNNPLYLDLNCLDEKEREKLLKKRN